MKRMEQQELLQNAIGMIGDDLINDADRKPRRPIVIRWSAVACACLAVIIAVSAGWLWRGDEPGVEPPDDDPPVVEPPGIDKLGGSYMTFTSWEELKVLCDAAQVSADDFLEKTRRIQRHCINFELILNPYDYPTYTNSRDMFLDAYNDIADYQIPIPLPSADVQLQHIYATSFGRSSVAVSYISYETPYGAILSTEPAGNYADEVATREGEPLASIDADGYSADVWSYNVRDHRYLCAYLTLDGDSYPTFKVSIYRYKDIPQELIPPLLSLFGQFRISTIQEMVENADTLDLPELPKFNVISEYQSAGKRLVDSVLVSEEEFLSTYPFVDGYSVLLSIFWPHNNQSEYEVQYRFDYALDPDTNEIDRSKLVSGVSRHLKDGKVGQVLCISKEGPVLNCAFVCDEVVVENFDGVDVELYDLSKDGQPLYYAVFKIGEYYVTYATYGGEQYDMILCVDWFIRNARDYCLIP